MHHAHQRGALCAHADTWKSPFSVAISCPQAAHYLGAAKTATAQYWTLCLRKVLKAKFAATKGEKRVMRNSAVRCAHASNQEIAIFSGDFVTAGGALPWRRQDGVYEADGRVSCGVACMFFAGRKRLKIVGRGAKKLTAAPKKPANIYYISR